MKKFFLSTITILLISCGEPTTEKPKAEIPQAPPETTSISPPIADTSFQEPLTDTAKPVEEREWFMEPEGGKIPPFVGKVSVIGGPFDKCDFPDCETVYQAPFDVKKPFTKLLVIDSGAALRQGKISPAIYSQSRFLEKLYQKHLEAMQATGGDSAYFEGTVVFKVTIGGEGSVEKVQILASNTKNPTFDREFRDSIATWKFPKANGKTVVSFPFKVYRTKYPKGFFEKRSTIGSL